MTRFPRQLARPLDPEVLACIVALERIHHANRALTEDERQEVYDTLVAVGWLPAPVPSTRTYESHRGAGTPGEFGRAG